jgi:hypothetical protein
MALWLYGNGLGRHYGYGTMAMALWHYGTMALWHHGTKAREGGIGLRRGEMVSGGYG